MSSSPFASGWAPSRERGFALLITITLLAFLVLLLVSLSSLTRVETQVASNSQSLSQAKQNALFSLNVALGELQRLAGPDRRVTATASLGDGANGIAAPVDGSRHWTGVWGDSALTTAGVPAPRLLGWLVSGSTATPVTQDTTALDHGRITSTAAAPAITPDKPVANLSASSTALSSNLTVNGSAAVLLAGPSTLGATAAEVPGYVVAPLVDINASAGTVPGLGATAAPLIGRYAWWVADEGVKARGNLTDAFAPRPASTDGASPAFTPTTAQAQFRLLAAQRVGVERVTDFSEIGSSLANTAAGADARVRLARTLSPGQLPLFDAGLTATEVKRRFHDITTQSAGVFSDTARGGLRADLGQLFNAATAADFRTRLQTYWNGDPSTTVARNLTAGVSLVDDLNRDGDYTDVWPNGPTWEELWSFSHMGNTPASSPAGVMTAGAAMPRAQTAIQHGIGPVLVQSRLYWGNSVRATGAGTNTVDVLLRPAFVLGNPYAVPLAACTYTVTVDLTAGMVIGWWVTGESAYRWSSNASFRLNNLKFQIECPQLAPGEARVFTLKYAQSGWNAASLNYPWSATGTYVFENDWDAGLAHIVIPATATITDADLTGAGKGIKMAFGMNSSGANTAGAQGFGNFSITLWGPDGLRLQRIENFGYGGIDYSSQNPVVTAVSARNWQGGLTMRRRGATDSPNQNIFQTHNGRAPLLARDSNTNLPAPVYGISHYTSRNWFDGELLLESPSPDQLRVYWGKMTQGTTGFRNNLPGGELFESVFYDVPAVTGPLVSLGQLQHFNAAGHMDGYTQTLGNPPTGTTDLSMRGQAAAAAYAIGNGRASPHIARTAVTTVNSNNRTVYDASWLLNRTLWDRYLFSSVPQTGAFDFATGLLPNPRLRPFRDTLASNAIDAYRATPASAAANLLNTGAFNINSTSVEAWRALFSSLNTIPYPGTATGLTGAFARSVRQISGNTSAGDGVSAAAWSGYRNLTPAEIDALATAMVAQVRARGPFVSLADFVNRRLDATTKGIQGAIDVAIETAGLNSGVSTFPYNAQPSLTSGLVVDGAHRESTQVAGIPGWVKQADLLQALGPVLAARSDTFVIRTYGEVKNPVTAVTEGRAWCEAVVQRRPDYVDSAADPAEDRATGLTATNATFGRRFVVVSFRWLAPEDI